MILSSSSLSFYLLLKDVAGVVLQVFVRWGLRNTYCRGTGNGRWGGSQAGTGPVGRACRDAGMRCDRRVRNYTRVPRPDSQTRRPSPRSCSSRACKSRGRNQRKWTSPMRGARKRIVATPRWNSSLVWKARLSGLNEGGRSAASHELRALSIDAQLEFKLGRISS